MTHDLAGIHFMMPTPFDDLGEIDYECIPRLIKLATDAGCKGVVCLGEMGEHHRLTESERDVVVKTAIDEAKGKLTVTVGATAQSTHMAVRNAAMAAELGGSATMVAPPRMERTNPETVFNFFKSIDDAVDIPIVVQDLPQSTNVIMPPAFIARLNQELEHIIYLNLEDPPTPPKVTSVRNIAGDDLGIFGGLGGVFLLEELLRGTCGTMTGFAYPEILVSVYNHLTNGEHNQAREVFYRYLPLIRYENQQGIGLSIRKEVLKFREALRTARVRRPGPEIDEMTRKELYETIESLGLQ